MKAPMLMPAMVMLMLMLMLGLAPLAEAQRRCINLNPYEPILNGLLDALPAREIQDLLPVPFLVNDGGEVWRMRINLLLCKLDIILDNVNVQVINTNFEKINLEVLNKETIFVTIPFGVQATSRIKADCGLYKPKITNQIEFAATISTNADVCVDMKALTNPANILNYTFATVRDTDYKAESQGFFWCITNALPLLKSIINKVIEDNVDKIWEAVDGVLREILFPVMEKAINGVLRAIGIQPYNSTATEDVLHFSPISKKEYVIKEQDKISVITTGNFSQLLYDSKSINAWMDGSFYRPSTTFAGYYPLGDYAQRNFNSANGRVQMVKDDGGIMVAKPLKYEQVWTDRGAAIFGKDGSFWKPVPPEGFVALGHVSQKGYKSPSTDAVRVIRSDCVVRCDPWLTWTDRCSGAWSDVSVWSVAETSSPSPAVLLSRPNYDRPADDMVFCLNPACVKMEN